MKHLTLLLASAALVVTSGAVLAHLGVLPGEHVGSSAVTVAATFVLPG